MYCSQCSGLNTSSTCYLCNFANKTIPKKYNNNEINSNLVWKIMDIDKQYTNHHQNSNESDQDLYSIESLNRSIWDYSLPTITLLNKSKRKSFLNTNKYQKRLFNKNPELKTIFDLFTESSTIFPLIAGEYPAQIIHNFWQNAKIDLEKASYVENKREFTQSASNIDIFFFKNNKTKIMDKVNEEERKKQANEYMQEILKCLYYFWQQNSDCDLCVTKTNYVLSLYVYKKTEPNHWEKITKYRFIYHIFNSKSEILHDFDLGSSQIGFDGSQFYITSLGKFAFEYGCNILDVSKMGLIYEKQLIEYFYRGFDIILPYLNTTKNTKLKLQFNNDNFIINYMVQIENKYIFKDFQIQHNWNNHVVTKEEIYEAVEEAEQYEFPDTIKDFTELAKKISKINFLILRNLFFTNSIYLEWTKTWLQMKQKCNLFPLTNLLNQTKHNWIYYATTSNFLDFDTLQLQPPLVNIKELVDNLIFQHCIDHSYKWNDNQNESGFIFIEHYINLLFFNHPELKIKYLKLFFEHRFIFHKIYELLDDDEEIQLIKKELIVFYEEMFQNQIKYVNLDLFQTRNWTQNNNNDYKNQILKLRNYPTLKSYYGSLLLI